MHVLLKALMRLPQPHLAYCLPLISEALLDDEHVKQVVLFAQLLETARFREFWSELEETKEIVEHVKGFATAVRDCALWRSVCMCVCRVCLRVALARDAIA